MGDDECRAHVPFGAEELRQPVLPLGIDAARGLVEDQQVRLRDEDRGETEPLALPAREIARVATLMAVEPDGSKRRAGAGEISPASERNLVLDALADQVPTRVLREVGRAAA